MALGRSSLSSTSCTAMACRAGTSRALMQPRQRAMKISNPGVSHSIQASTASTRACTMERLWLSRSRRRRSTRSLHTPAKAEKKRMGIWLAKPTLPSTNAELESR